jgi:tetratricopeptide (TPR) repeat protein
MSHVGRNGSWMACAIVFVSLIGSVARGEVSEADLARARALFERATLLREQGDHVAAANQLREALEIKETPGLRFHLAHALEQVGQLRAARQEYERARILITRGHAAGDVEELLGPALRRLEQATPTLEVELPEGISDAQVTVDGERVRPASRIPLDPGPRRVSVRAPERAPFEAEVLLTEGDRRVVVAALPLVTQEKVTPTPFPWREVVLAGEAGFVGMALGFAVLQTIAAANARDDIAAQEALLDEEAPGAFDVCAQSDPPLACRNLAAALEDRQAAQRWATVGYAAAGAGVVAFVGTLVFWPPRVPAGTDTQVARRRPLRVDAASLPAGGMVTLAGVF